MGTECSRRRWVRGQERKAITPHVCSAVPRGKRSAVQGDGQLHRESPGGDRAGAFPDRVPGEVVSRGSGQAAVSAGTSDTRHGGVHLDAERIGHEGEGAPAVEKGVDHDPHDVVPEGQVAVAVVGTDRRRLGIGGEEGDVEALVVIEQQAAGGNRRGNVVTGIGLEGQVEAQGPLPGRLVELPVDGDRFSAFREPRDVAGEGGSGGEKREGEQEEAAGWGHRRSWSGVGRTSMPTASIPRQRGTAPNGDAAGGGWVNAPLDRLFAPG
ncbi:MAG: hypothetical protein Q9Q13_06795 [Acidobacteriota bacterium]|nr:hypothetical protein [Acidobacteriota bacterium]